MTRSSKTKINLSNYQDKRYENTIDNFLAIITKQDCFISLFNIIYFVY